MSPPASLAPPQGRGWRGKTEPSSPKMPPRFEPKAEPHAAEHVGVHHFGIGEQPLQAAGHFRHQRRTTGQDQAVDVFGRNSGEAQRLAQEALKKNPDYRPAMVTLARDHYRRRRLDLALYTLQGILDGYGPENPPRDKNNAEARLLRGLIYRERNQRGLAIDELTRAVELRPDLVEARLQLATYMLEAGNAQGALPHLEAAVRYDHKNVLARLNLGDAYRLAERPADARRELEWVAKAAPERVEVHYNLGLLFLLSKSIPGMTPIQATNKAIEHLEAYRERGVRGGPDDTEELITRAKTRKALLEAEAQEAKGARDTAAEPPTEEAP